MSLIIAVHVDEGIVIASDSRTTYTTTNTLEGNIVKEVGSHITDTTGKTFICPNGVGISTCGNSSIKNKPIAGYIQKMIREKINKDTVIDDIPKIIIDFFNMYDAVPDTNFIVAGYNKTGPILVQKLYYLNVKSKNIEDIETSFQGAKWAGETAVLTKLIKKDGIKNSDGTYNDLPNSEILWHYFTLQDAVDFARYAVETTIQTMRFQRCVKTVGGDVDILVITPDETKWLQKKELL